MKLLTPCHRIPFTYGERNLWSAAARPRAGTVVGATPCVYLDTGARGKHRVSQASVFFNHKGHKGFHKGHESCHRILRTDANDFIRARSCHSRIPLLHRKNTPPFFIHRVHRFTLISIVN